MAQRYVDSPVTLLGITSITRQRARSLHYDEVITRNTLLSPDRGIEEAFEHRSIDLGSRPPKRAFVSAFLFAYRSLDHRIPHSRYERFHRRSYVSRARCRKRNYVARRSDGA